MWRAGRRWAAGRRGSAAAAAWPAWPAVRRALAGAAASQPAGASAPPLAVESVRALLRQTQDAVARVDATADWAAMRRELAELDGKLQAPDLWSDARAASAVSRRAGELKARLAEVERLGTQLEEHRQLLELAEVEHDDALLAEVHGALAPLCKTAEETAFRARMSDEADSLGCFVEVRAGAGGLESMDWTQMLVRMYSRWAASKHYAVEVADEQAGDQAGLRHAVLQITGPYAYGWLKHESGVHRMVRMSPFDANGKRHTSFASVHVQPLIDEGDASVIEIDPSQLRIDVFRASGAGGQHVNKTESAVRITHIPTGIVVACQNDRSQHRNRRIAMAMLRAKLYEQELQRKRERLAVQNATLPPNAFGSQIRSYVLQPYQLVKDAGTGVEHGNPEAVLDGDLDRFLQAALHSRSATR